MEKDARYFWVGLFVVTAITAVTGFVIWLMGTPGDAREYKRYTAYFTESVAGLEEGANVLYQGVKVGKVIGLRIDSGEENIVKADLEIADTTPIRSRTKAAIAPQGVTGLVHLELRTAPKDEKPPRQEEGEQYPVIDGTGSQWAKAVEDLPVITQQIREITGKINGVMTPQAMEKVSGYLD